jgi:hypothetical protein
MRAREYDPSTGRFMSQDPVAAAPTDPYVADYLYTNDNPVTRIDPSGRDWFVKAFTWVVSNTVGPYLTGKDVNDPLTNMWTGNEPTYDQCGWIGQVASLIPWQIGTVIGYGCSPTQGVSDNEEQALRQQLQQQQQQSAPHPAQAPRK